MLKDKDATSAGQPQPQTCPKCGGELEPPTEDKVTCRYCGASFDADGLGDGSPVDPIAELYERGRAAFARLDYAAAYESFDRITDNYPNEYEAWLEKGVAGAYKELMEEERVDADELLLRLEKALELYRGDDREAFERRAADHLGAVALDLYDHAVQRGADGEANVKGLLDLLFFWETSGSDEVAAWNGVVRLAEETATPEGKRPLAHVAEKYKKKIRGKVEAEAKAAAEAKAKAAAEAKGEVPEEKAAEPSRKSGRGVWIAIAIVAGIAILCILCFVTLAIIGW
jgi:tetratricopeptide (TPR) repeat protein